MLKIIIDLFKIGLKIILFIIAAIIIFLIGINIADTLGTIISCILIFIGFIFTFCSENFKEDMTPISASVLFIIFIYLPGLYGMVKLVKFFWEN